MDPVTYTVTFMVKDENGQVISDAVITLGGTANPAGNYVFENVLPGTYSYSVTANEFITVAVDNFVVTDDVTENVVMTAVTYTVTFVVKDQDAAAITDAVITFGETTNAAGDYIFDGIVAGNYDYAVEADGYYIVAVTGFNVTADATIEVTLTLITFTVTFEIKDVDGTELPNAVVTLGDITNNPGNYVFTEVVPGLYDYSVVAAGYVDVEVLNFEISEDTVIQVNMELFIPTFTVTFEVEDESGTIISDAVITFDGMEYGAGDYVFEELEAGTYPYIVSREGYLIR
jgi:hypothetical protein